MGDLLTYGFHLLGVQLHIVFNSKKIEKIIHRKDISPKIVDKLNLTQKIRTFGIDSLGFRETKSYLRYYKHDEALLYVLIASEKYKLQPYLWRFPIIGKVSYKGFFDPIMARREWESLLKKGHDVRLRMVNAWSTLGYFPDPVTSGMLEMDEPILTNTILHEMFHATLFIPGNTDLSENLATMIGDNATYLYLKQKYGAESSECRQFLHDLERTSKFNKFMKEATERLDSLYNSEEFVKQSDIRKDSTKKHFIQKLMEDCPEKLSDLPKSCKYAQEISKHPNNAVFIIFKQYHGLQDEYNIWFEQTSDLKNYIKSLKEKYGNN